MSKNILITSLGEKVPLIKTVINAKNEYDKSIKVLGIDINNQILGKYFVEEFYVIPRLSILEIHEFINFCIKHLVGYIIPTRDEDVLFFAKNKQILKENGMGL